MSNRLAYIPTPVNDNHIMPSHILIEARRLIALPHNWSKGPMAMDRVGIEVSPLDHAAYAWDCGGATERAARNLLGPDTTDHGTNADRYLLEVGGGEIFNDLHTTTHAMMLDKFDLAIARAQIVEAGSSSSI